MTEYGVMINGQLLIHKTRKDGDQEIVRTPAPDIEYDETVHFWFEEENGKIVQKWGKEKLPDPPDPDPEVDDEEALEILLGGAE